MNQIETHKLEFDRLGYTIIPDFIPPTTAMKLKELSQNDEAMRKNSHSVLDGSGRKSKLTLWYYPGHDVFGRLSCSDKMIKTMAFLLGGEVSFFHAKLMNKEAQKGGQWEWHQDYGYWYDDGFLRPDMASCFVALDPCTKENGALRVIPKSHHSGRLDHGVVGEQAGADMNRVEPLKNIYGTKICNMSPGGALFFHSNLLHASGPNLSTQSRLILISSFFRRDNRSINDDARYQNKDTPVIPHDQILEGATTLDDRLDFSRAEAHKIQ